MPCIIINHHSTQVYINNNHILLSNVRLLPLFKCDMLWDFTWCSQIFLALFLYCLTLKGGTYTLT